MADLRGALVGGTRVFLLIACLAWAGSVSAGSFVGRPVEDVLRQLSRQDGVNFIYNTELVPPALVVSAEPDSRDAVGIAREILAPHGLALSAVGDSAYAVVRAPAVKRAESPDSGAAPIAEIVVTTSRYALAYQDPQSHEFLAQADTQSMPKLADDPLRSVQRLPGTATYGLSAQSHVRGGEVDENLMVLDGLPLYEPFHLKNFLAPVSVFDEAAIQSIDVSSGGFAANYGDRMSSVIDISSLQPPADRYTELGMSLYHASALSTGKFAGDRGHWLGAARRSNLDFFANAFDFEYGDPSYYDMFGRVSYALTDTTTLIGSALASRDDIHANNGDDTNREHTDNHNNYLWGGLEQQWGAGFSSRLILGLTDIDNEREGTMNDPEEITGSVYDHRALQSYLARLDIRHAAERFYTRFGVEGRHLDAGYHYRSTATYAQNYPFPGDPSTTTTRDLNPNPDGNQFGVYVTSRARVTDRLTSEIGLRWDDQTYDNVSGPDQWSPRLNLMYDLTPATRLRLAWGRFWQAQGINELQVEDGVGTFYKPQQVDQLIASVEQTLRPGIDLRVELYQKDYDRVRPHFENLFDPVRLMPELEPDRVEVAPDHSRARGAEFTLAVEDDGPWSGSMSYVWSRVTDRIDGEDVVRSWDQRHLVSATLRYVSQPWEVSITDTYHTGWPTTGLYLAPTPGGGADVATVGPRNAEQYAAFNSLDFRVVRHYALADSELDAFFELTNALARRNPCCTENDVTERSGQTVIDTDIKHWPRLVPNLGVNWKF